MQTRRAALLERESALQRWAVQLELEGAKQVAAGKALQQQLQKVRECCLWLVSPCEPWQGPEGPDCVRAAEMALLMPLVGAVQAGLNVWS